MTKSEQKQLDRALAAGGHGLYLRTLAQIHRSGSSRTQKTVEAWIAEAGAEDQFVRINGALVHQSEV